MAPSLVARSPNVDNRQQASNDGDVVFNSGLVIADREFANVKGDDLDWNVLNIDFVDFLNPQTDDEIVQDPSWISSLVHHSTFAIDQTVQVQQLTSSPITSIPTLLTYAPRSLMQRPKLKAGVQRVANLIFSTLKSYPLMMTLHNILPPFIHSRLLSSRVENDDMEPLTNCIHLVRMISNRDQGSRKLFWRNVRLECERLCEEQSRLSKWGLLAALQALSIYIIVRLDEGETDHNNFDHLLLATVTAMSRQITSVNITHNTASAPPCSCGLENGWRDWIFEESGRRICVIYQVLDMVVFFEPAAMCNLPSELILAPLPTKKQLWEARDACVWKAEIERGPRVHATLGLATNGRLVKIDEGQLSRSNTTLYQKSLEAGTLLWPTADWEEWYSGMDGLGVLVMLAASLLG